MESQLDARVLVEDPATAVRVAYLVLLERTRRILPAPARSSQLAAGSRQVSELLLTPRT